MFERHEEELREKRNKSTYGETFGKGGKGKESIKEDIDELRKKVNQIMTYTAAGKPRYGDLLKTEKELQNNLWESLG